MTVTRINPEKTVVFTASPTMEQLKNAVAVTALVNFSGTSSNSSIACFPETLCVSNNDYNGQYRVSAATWSKQNGTLSVMNGNLQNVMLVF